MNSSFLIEAAKQIPALAVLVYLVFHFLKHMKEENKAVRETYRDMKDSDTEAKKSLTDAMTENTKILAIVANMLDKKD